MCSKILVENKFFPLFYVIFMLNSSIQLEGIETF